MKTLIFILTLLFSVNTFALTKEQMCQDKAVFVYYMALGRDNGQTLNKAKENIDNVIKKYPELVSSNEHKQMIMIVELIHNNKNISKDDLSALFFKTCMDGKKM